MALWLAIITNCFILLLKEDFRSLSRLLSFFVDGMEDLFQYLMTLMGRLIWAFEYGELNFFPLKSALVVLCEIVVHHSIFWDYISEEFEEERPTQGTNTDKGCKIKHLRLEPSRPRPLAKPTGFQSLDRMPIETSLVK